MEKTGSSFKVQLMLAAFAAFACIALSGAFAQSAYADGAAEFPVKGFKGSATGYLSPSNDEVYVTGTKSFSALKSSNKKVATVKKDGSKRLLITMKKAGTTNISFKYNGKVRTVKFKVKKYVNPVKTFKIGSANLAGKFKKDNLFLGTGKSYKGKLNVKAKSGWKLATIVKISGDDDSEDGWKTVKNGSKVTADDMILGLKFYNKAANGYSALLANVWSF